MSTSYSQLDFHIFQECASKAIADVFPSHFDLFPVNFQLRSARDGTSLPISLLLLRHLVASWNLGTSFPCLCRHRTFLLETDTSICRRDWIDFVLSSFKPKGETYSFCRSMETSPRLRQPDNLIPTRPIQTPPSLFLRYTWRVWSWTPG